MINIWSNNHPRDFWLCQPEIDNETWEEAIRMALPALGLPIKPQDIDSLLELTLGEGQFGAGHWTLGPAKKMYYFLKPLLPRSLTRRLRQSLRDNQKREFMLGWPVEDRYPSFLYNTIDNVLSLTGQQCIQCRPLWPEGKRFAFVLTHDIEGAEGQRFVRAVADLEESLGFRSSFNFVPEGYAIDKNLVQELRQRGFEIGLHGLKHDGKLFYSREGFERSAKQINKYLEEFEAVGFRAPLTIRNPEWLQALKIEYDLSFFDTDPFEPIPGGTMSIWPFFIGHFVELPYTLVQDYTLLILGESSPRLWLDKVDFICSYHGMALLDSHPDYLRKPESLAIYKDFLNAMKHRQDFWHALPCEVARWWQNRSAMDGAWLPEDVKTYATIAIRDGKLTWEEPERAPMLGMS